MDHKFFQHLLQSFPTNIQQQTCTLLRNEFDFWNVHGIMNTSGLLQSK